MKKKKLIIQRSNIVELVFRFPVRFIFFPNLQVEGECFEIAYDWIFGTIRTYAVVPESFSTTSIVSFPFQSIA